MIATRTLIAFLLSALASMSAQPASADAPFTFLNIPVRGSIGIDTTLEGIDQAIQLATSKGIDGITFEINSASGYMTSGVAIAERIAKASSKLRTIAIIRTAGGPALPIAFACRDWVVLETVDGEGPTRTVLETLPHFAPDPNDVKAQLAANAEACAKVSEPTDPYTKRARDVLIYALFNPGFDLLLGKNNDGGRSIRAAPIDRTDDDGSTRIAVASRGPGIDANGLATAGIAYVAPEGLDAFAKAIGVDAVSPQGDTGLMLVGSIAEEQFNERRRLGSQIDSMMTLIDGIDSLSSAVPWSLQRAKLADPDTQSMLWRYPMRFTDGVWVFTQPAIEQWRRVINNSVRRWSGVETLSKEISALVEKLESIHTKLKDAQAGPIDRDRLAAAIKLVNDRLPGLRKINTDYSPLASQARTRITELEQLIESTPTITPGE